MKGDSMNKNDLYKFRAEEFSKSFESFRAMEWQIIFQLYTGYTLLGTAYSYLINKNPHNILFARMIIGATVLLFFSTLYLSLRIQERQKFARTMQNAYLEKLHKALKVPLIEKLPNAETPKHQWRYAFAIQTLLSASIALGLIIYVLQLS
jgi:hypothetical protein